MHSVQRSVRVSIKASVLEQKQSALTEILEQLQSGTTDAIINDL